MTSFNPFPKRKNGDTDAVLFPKGARLNPRAAAQALLAAGPSHLLKPVGTPMADALMAAGEQAMAMNPIRLASPAQVEANQLATYGAPAGAVQPLGLSRRYAGRPQPLGPAPRHSTKDDIMYAAAAGTPEAALPAVEVVQPQGVHQRGVSGAPGEPVELWVNPPDGRQIPIGRDSIPAPDPRSQKDQSRLPPLKHQSRLTPTKDQSRLGAPQGTPRLPSRNPKRAPNETYPLTVAPKGGLARPATELDATRFSPDDSLGDSLYKAGQNFGDDLEGVADHVVPWIPESLFLRDLADYGVGYFQTFSNRRQKRENLVDEMREHNKRRYQDPGAFTEQPLTTTIDGFFANTLGLYGLPTVSGLIEQRRARDAKGKAGSE